MIPFWIRKVDASGEIQRCSPRCRDILTKMFQCMLRSAIKRCLTYINCGMQLIPDLKQTVCGPKRAAKGSRIYAKSVLNASYRALVPARLSLAVLRDCDSCMHILKRNADVATFLVDHVIDRVSGGLQDTGKELKAAVVPRCSYPVRVSIG